MADVREEIRTDLEHQFRRGYRLGTLILACYFLALLPYYLTAYPPPYNRIIGMVTATTVLMLIAILGLLHYDRIPPRRYQFLCSMAIGFILLPILTLLALVPDARFNAEIGFLLVISALVLHDWAFYIPIQVVVVGLWVGVLLAFNYPGNHLQLGLTILSALIVSITAHLITRGLIRNQLELRWQDRVREAEKVRLLAELEIAFERVRTLRGLVPICAQCKKVRDDQGFWQRVETYVEAHSHAEFTHGLCPECMDHLKAEFEDAPLSRNRHDRPAP